METHSPPMSPAMTDIDDAMRAVIAVRELADRSYLELDNMKTPHDVFEERQRAINVKIDQALRAHHCARDSAESAKCRDDILSFGVKLNQLSEDYRVTMDQKAKDYQRRRHLTIEKLSEGLILALGVDVAEKAMQDLKERASKEDNSVTAEQPTPSVTDPDFDPEADMADTASSLNRERLSEPPEEPPTKRRRTARSKRIETTIWFDQVYQKGRAPTKHIIVEHPKDSAQWYIIRRCDECDRDFKDKPLVSAGSHLNSTKHGQQGRDAATVIDKLGIAVLECSPSRAKMNNEVATRAFREETRSGRLGDNAGANTNGHRHGRRGGFGITHPTPGHIYLGYWEKAKKSWPVLLLPTEKLDKVGVADSLESLRLLDNLPSCYRYDGTTQSLEWEEGFEDGGADVARRQFPVMFFDDGLEFPSKSEVGWLAADNLEELEVFSAATADVPHIRSARQYLRKRLDTGTTERMSHVSRDGANEANGNTDEVHTGSTNDDSNPHRPEAAQCHDENTTKTGQQAGSEGEQADGPDETTAVGSLLSQGFSQESIQEPGSSAPEPAKAQMANVDIDSTASPHHTTTNPEPPHAANFVADSSVKTPPSNHKPTSDALGGSQPFAAYLATIAQETLHHDAQPHGSVSPPAEQQDTSSRPMLSRNNTKESLPPLNNGDSQSRMVGDNRPTSQGEPGPDRNPPTHPLHPHQNHNPRLPKVAYKPIYARVPPIHETSTASNPYHIDSRPAVPQGRPATHGLPVMDEAHERTWSASYEGNPGTMFAGDYGHSGVWSASASDGASHFQPSHHTRPPSNPPSFTAINGPNGMNATQQSHTAVPTHQIYLPPHHIIHGMGAARSGA